MSLSKLMLLEKSEIPIFLQMKMIGIILLLLNFQEQL